MPVFDLKKRITDDWDNYNQLKKTDESAIYVRGKIILDNDGPESLNLTVGDSYIFHDKILKIPDKGVKIPSGKSLVIETEQYIAAPYNMHGIIVGVGANIFRSGFISSGKIDPGFKGKLKIAYYNGNHRSIIFKRGDLLACCSFWPIETPLDFALENYHSEPEAVLEEKNIFQSICSWLKHNWYSALALIISILTFIFSNVVK